MNTTTRTARIPFELDDISLDDARAIIASCPSVTAILRDDDPPRSSADSHAFIVLTDDADVLVRDICDALNDDPDDDTRVAFLD